MITSSTFGTATMQNATLYVPAGSKASYSQNPYWKNFFNIQDGIPAGVESVEADRQETQTGNGAIYTVDGIRLNATNTENLPSGIYIVNEKKYIVK